MNIGILIKKLCFYGVNSDELFKDFIFEIEDEDTGAIYETVLKQISPYDDDTDQIKLALYPFISKKLQNIFEYYQIDITPAQGLKEALQLNGLNDYIDDVSFDNADYFTNSSWIIM